MTRRKPPKLLQSLEQMALQAQTSSLGSVRANLAAALAVQGRQAMALEKAQAALEFDRQQGQPHAIRADLELLAKLFAKRRPIG